MEKGQAAAIAIQWSQGDGLINAIRDDGQLVELEAENWRSALLEFAPALPAGGWGDLMMAAWTRIDWPKVVEAGRGGGTIRPARLTGRAGTLLRGECGQAQLKDSGG